jgi:hypothetical protein
MTAGQQKSKRLPLSPSDQFARRRSEIRTANPLGGAGQHDAEAAAVLPAAIRCLEKLTALQNLPERQRRVLRKALRVLVGFPEVTINSPISIEVRSPRHMVAGREVVYWWNLHLEDDCGHVSSGGQVSGPEQDPAEIFVRFTWDAAPDVPPVYRRYERPPGLVDSEAPFDREVDEMDFSGAGYTFAVSPVR